MGLDIYAGTLTRYYAQNWKTVVQQWAEANGYNFSRLTPDGGGNEGQKPDPQEVQADMEAWRDEILAAVAAEGKKPYGPWVENNEKPYYTDKPDWDAFGALLLYAACKLYKEPLPASIEKDWDFYEHPIIKRLMEDDEKLWSLFVGAEFWIPIDGTFYFRGQSPAGDEKIIAATGALLAELKKINEIGWNADRKTILRWGSTEGYPADGEMVDGKLVNFGGITEYDTESLAKFAFSILYQAAAFSQENAVPIVLDY